MQYDALIVGGGLSGLQTALSLGTHDMRVAVIDRLPLKDIVNADFDGRTCAISYASANVMKKSGVWDSLSPYACPMTNIDIEDGNMLGDVSYFSMHYDSDLVGGEPLGYIIENNTMRTKQYEALQKLDRVDYFADTIISDIICDDKQSKIILSDGRELVGSVVLGCDGRNSLVRQSAHIEQVEISYNQSAIVCTVTCEKPHNGLALELFLPSGPFAMLPMTENRMSIVWSEKPEMVKRYLNMTESDFSYHLQQRAGDRYGRISVVADRRFSYPLSMRHAKRYVSTRLALIADSAHGMHPIAGQGLNVGIRDVAAMVECMVNAKRNGVDVGSDAVLKEYEQYRYADNTALLAITDGLTRLFSNDNSALRLARTLGLGMLNKIPPAKKLFMRHAMGTAGTHIPKLLKGEDI